MQTANRPFHVHPLAEVWPHMPQDQFEAFLVDVAGGQREPVTVYEGLLLDGRSRQRALLEHAETTGKPFKIQYVVWDCKGNEL